MNDFPTDPWTVTNTAAAIKQRYRIEPCAACGGPEVFSKAHALSRCLRCGAKREHLAVKQHKTSWRRCALCDKQDMAGVLLSKRYCRACDALSSHERAKRLRWKAEQAATPAQVPSNSPMNTGLSEKEPA